MAYRDIDMNLTEEQIAVRDTVRKFGAEVVRPAGEKLDKIADPAEVIAKGSVYWDVFRTFHELGFHKRGIPKALGGMLEDMDPWANYYVREELGYADAGFDIAFSATTMPFAMASMFPAPRLQEIAKAYAADNRGELIGCWGITEPDHGGDWSLGGSNPKCGPSCRAVLKGDEYIINGQKAAWVTNGTTATHAVMHIGLQPELGMEGQGLAIVPLDLPGITKGKPLDKIGKRCQNQGELFFNDVKLHKDYMVILPEYQMLGKPGGQMNDMILAGANGGMGITFAGLAKAAYDEAFKYANERIQGGVPIIQHQNVALKLFKMFTLVEAARAAARRTYQYNTFSGQVSCAHSVACKCFSTEAAFQVASEAIQIFGGNGLSREYPVEKMLRDARTGMIEDGVNETLSLSAIPYL